MVWRFEMLIKIKGGILSTDLDMLNKKKAFIKSVRVEALIWDHSITNVTLLKAKLTQDKHSCLTEPN